MNRSRRLLAACVMAGAVVAASLLTGCGGGYEGTPSPIDTTDQALKVVTAPAITLMPKEIRRLEVTGGTRPYTVTSGNREVILADVSDGTLSLAAVQGATVPVTVTVADAKNSRTTLTVNVTNAPQQGNFSIEPRIVAIQPGTTRDLTLVGGAAPYTATSLSPHIAGVTVNGNTLTVTGVAEGVNAEIRVFDSRRVTQSAFVTVAAPLPSTSGLALSVNWTNPLALRPRTSQTYTITGGVPPYQVVSSQTSVIDAQIRGSALMLQSRSAGNSTLTVTDSNGTEVSQQVFVMTTTAPLSLNLNTVVGQRLDVVDVGIAGGLPPYTAVTTALNSIANASVVNGDVLRLQLLNPGGPASVSVRDSEGNTANLSVSVTGAEVLSRIAVSPSTMTVSELLTDSLPIRIVNGRPPFRVFSSYPNMLTPEVLEESPNVITVTPVFMCVDQNTAVVITVIDDTGASASTTITVQDNGDCGN